MPVDGWKAGDRPGCRLREESPASALPGPITNAATTPAAPANIRNRSGLGEEKHAGLPGDFAKEAEYPEYVAVGKIRIKGH